MDSHHIRCTEELDIHQLMMIGFDPGEDELVPGPPLTVSVAPDPVDEDERLEHLIRDLFG